MGDGTQDIETGQSASERPRARWPLCATLASDPPLPPRLAFVRTPVWERTAADTREAFDELDAPIRRVS